MARAIACCKCEKCGESFEKMKYGCRNRSEANSWEEWAESNYSLCSECWKKEKDEKLLKDPQFYEKRIHYSEYKKEYSLWCKQKNGTYDKSDKTIEVIIDKEKERIFEKLKNKDVEDLEVEDIKNFLLSFKASYAVLLSFKASYAGQCFQEYDTCIIIEDKEKGFDHPFWRHSDNATYQGKKVEELTSDEIDNIFDNNKYYYVKLGDFVSKTKEYILLKDDKEAKEHLINLFEKRHMFVV